MISFYIKRGKITLVSNKIINAIIILILFYNINIWAQEDSIRFKLDASIRERFESWDGMNAKNYGDPNGVGSLNDNFLLQRVIAGFTYTPRKNIIISAHMQDSRAFGWSLRNSKYPDLFKIPNAKSTSYYKRNPNEEFFEIYDLSVEYKGLITDSLILKVGRQKIYFGDKRIFGPGDWGNTGNWTWDAVKFTYSNKNNFISAFAGGTKIHDPNKTSLPFTNTEFWGVGGYSHFYFPDYIILEPFYAYKTEGSADYINSLSIHRHWIGTRLFYPDLHSFLYDITLVKEFGRENGMDIDAYGYVAMLGYQFKQLFSEPRISLRRSYASGGNEGNRIKTFDGIYGSIDSYYGRMNIVKWSNIEDNEILLELYPLRKLSVEISYNNFRIPSPEGVKLLSTIQLMPGEHYLGDEIDIFIQYKGFRSLELTGAFGYFWPGNIMPINNLPAKNASWFALQILYVFNQR